MNEENVKIQMRKGILEYCILAILSRGDSYAPKIIAELKAAHMIVVEGTLYPILTRQKECRTADIPMGGVAAGAAAKILHAHRSGTGTARRSGRGVGRDGGTDTYHPPRQVTRSGTNINTN